MLCHYFENNVIDKGDILSNKIIGKNEKLDEWGYPIHPEYNFEKPEGDFETRIALVIVFSLIIIGIIII